MFEQLFNKRANVIKPGLERIAAAYEFLGRPGASTPTILVAGTNGKGTTSAFMWQAFAQAGIRVGLYTSPHLTHFSQRFLVAGEQKITDGYVAELWRELEELLPAAMYEELSFFEVATLIAFTVFERSQTVVNILEVGLGGRWDATNISSPSVSVITSIGLDHQQYLGNDVVQIAQEKAGIMRRGRPVVIGKSGINGAVLDVIAQAAQESGAHPIYLDQPFPATDLPQHLAHNFALAQLAVREFLNAQGWPSITLPTADNAQELLHSIPAVRGRYERIEVEPERVLIFDVAHNVDGIAALLAQLQRDFPGVIPKFFVSILQDKAVEPMLNLITAAGIEPALFSIDNSRTFRAQDLSAQYQRLDFYDSFAQAWIACKDDWPKTVPWIVCGSLAAVGSVFEFFGINP